MNKPKNLMIDFVGYFTNITKSKNISILRATCGKTAHLLFDRYFNLLYLVYKYS